MPPPLRPPPVTVETALLRQAVKMWEAPYGPKGAPLSIPSIERVIDILRDEISARLEAGLDAGAAVEAAVRVAEEEAHHLRRQDAHARARRRWEDLGRAAQSGNPEEYAEARARVLHVGTKTSEKEVAAADKLR